MLFQVHSIKMNFTQTASLYAYRTLYAFRVCSYIQPHCVYTGTMAHAISQGKLQSGCQSSRIEAHMWLKTRNTDFLSITNGDGTALIHK